MAKADSVLLWAPRVAGVAVALFLALFALDAFSGKRFAEALPAFIIHLGPALLVLAAVAVSWRFPLMGTAAFLGLALVYALMARWRLDWVAVISGPLALVGTLSLVSWYRVRGLRA